MVRQPAAEVQFRWYQQGIGTYQRSLSAILERRIRMTAFWHRLPVAVRAVIAAFLVLLAGNLPWGVLVTANARFNPSVPWAALVMACYLWFCWRWLEGPGRRGHLRANPLRGRVWGWSLLAGASSLLALVELLSVLGRLVSEPPQQIAQHTPYPFLFALSALVMSGVVSGVFEESGFRGYLQAPLERRYGPAIAIAVTSLFFALMHITHGLALLAFLLPYYLAVSVVYGILAWRTGSILPGLALHSMGDAVSNVVAWRRGPLVARPLVWQTGPDLHFEMTLLAAIILALVAAWAFRRMDPRRATQ
jgi:membrane protease YdiL (CAAX protease family)